MVILCNILLSTSIVPVILNKGNHNDMKSWLAGLKNNVPGINAYINWPPTQRACYSQVINWPVRNLKVFIEALTGRLYKVPVMYTSNLYAPVGIEQRKLWSHRTGGLQ